MIIQKFSYRPMPYQNATPPGEKCGLATLSLSFLVSHTSQHAMRARHRNDAAVIFSLTGGAPHWCKHLDIANDSVRCTAGRALQAPTKLLRFIVASARLSQDRRNRQWVQELCGSPVNVRNRRSKRLFHQETSSRQPPTAHPEGETWRGDIAVGRLVEEKHHENAARAPIAQLWRTYCLRIESTQLFTIASTQYFTIASTQ